MLETAIPTARSLYGGPIAPEPEQEHREERFFQSVKLKNGTYKTTYSRRLDDFNRAIQSALPDGKGPLEVMDVAISSGVSTMEWLQSLEVSGRQVRMVAGDKTIGGFLLEHPLGLSVLSDLDTHVLQYGVLGRSIANPPGGRNLVKFGGVILFLRGYLSVQRETIQSLLGCYDEEQVLPGGFRGKRIHIVSPRLLKTPNLELVEDDILSNACFPKRFHVLRAANILNRAYFSDDILRRMVRQLRTRIQPGGLFAVCRTNAESVNHGTVFALDDDLKFSVRDRVGEGSEIEALILATS